MKNFETSCVNHPNVEELHHIVDNARKITRRTFLKHVNREELKQLESDLGYGKQFPITQDYHVSFCKSRKAGGKTVYFLCHSAIEYIFS